MREMLEGGLKWFCDEKRGREHPLVLKLEARSNNDVFETLCIILKILIFSQIWKGDVEEHTRRCG